MDVACIPTLCTRGALELPMLLPLSSSVRKRSPSCSSSTQVSWAEGLAWSSTTPASWMRAALEVLVSTVMTAAAGLYTALPASIRSSRKPCPSVTLLQSCCPVQSAATCCSAGCAMLTRTLRWSLARRTREACSQTAWQEKGAWFTLQSTGFSCNPWPQSQKPEGQFP